MNTKDRKRPSPYGERFLLLRRALDWPQKRLEKELGVGPGLVKAHENGWRTTVQNKTALRLLQLEKEYGGRLEVYREEEAATDRRQRIHPLRLRFIRPPDLQALGKGLVAMDRAGSAEEGRQRRGSGPGA